MSIVKGTFVSASTVAVGQLSDALVIPSGVTSMKVSLGGAKGGTINASNTVRTQKSTNSGQTWANVTTYNSAQASASVAVAMGEQWRLQVITQQAGKSLGYELSVES